METKALGRWSADLPTVYCPICTAQITAEAMIASKSIETSDEWKQLHGKREQLEMLIQSKRTTPKKPSWTALEEISEMDNAVKEFGDHQLPG